MEAIKVSTNLYRGEQVKDIKELQQLANEHKSVAFQVGGYNKRWMVRPAAVITRWQIDEVNKRMFYKTLKKGKLDEDVARIGELANTPIEVNKIEVQDVEFEEELDLTKILKGCEGMKFWHLIYGWVTLHEIITKETSYPIMLKRNDFNNTFLCADGRFNYYFDGECLLFPSKECRDWSKFVRPRKDLEKGTPVCLFNRMTNISDIYLAKYNNTCALWNHVVPVDKIDLNTFTFDSKDDYGTKSKYSTNYSSDK